MQDVNRGEVAPWVTCGHHEGQSKAWPAVAGTWTGMGVDVECCTHVCTRFFPRRQEGGPMRKAYNPFHGKRRYGAHAEPWLDSNLFVTLPQDHPVCSSILVIPSWTYSHPEDVILLVYLTSYGAW